MCSCSVSRQEVDSRRDAALVRILRLLSLYIYIFTSTYIHVYVNVYVYIIYMYNIGFLLTLNPSRQEVDSRRDAALARILRSRACDARAIMGLSRSSLPTLAEVSLRLAFSRESHYQYLCRMAKQGGAGGNRMLRNIDCTIKGGVQ